MRNRQLRRTINVTYVNEIPQFDRAFPQNHNTRYEISYYVLQSEFYAHSERPAHYQQTAQIQARASRPMTSPSTKTI
jgi:hypothetical protein